MSLKVLGMRRLRRTLERMPAKAAAKIIRPAINQSATIVQKAAKSLAPVGKGGAVNKDGTPRVRLKKAIIKRIKQRRGNLIAAIGPGYKVAPHDHLVHDGTKPHSLGKKQTTTASGVGLSRAGRTTRRKRTISVSQDDGAFHPGTQANPYMRKAYEKTRRQVVAKFVSVAKLRLKQLAR